MGSEAAALLVGTEHCEPRAALLARLEAGEHLRIKWGVDPSAPDLHLGHTVPMRLLRRWQRAGHTPVVIVGDLTARIGDPSGRSATRPQLSPDEVEANATTYLEQLFTLLDPDATEVRRQSEWFQGFGLAEVLRLAAQSTVAQLLQRADFSQRMAAERPIGVHELLYPLLQGYDSVAVAADVELGGTDQLFNLLAAREIQAAFGQPPQAIVTVPLLEGLDGHRKMSKSLGNAVGVRAPATEQFGQLMSIGDELVDRYWALLTEVDEARRASVRAGVAAGTIHPRDAKAEMARSVVAELHGAAAAAAAAAAFDAVHRQGRAPVEMPVAAVLTGAAQDPREILVAAGLATSRGAAARLVQQGGVRLNERRLVSWTEPLTPAPGSVLRVGPRRFVRLELRPAPR